MTCICGRDALDGKRTCGSVACGSSTGNTQSLGEMAAIAERAMAKSLDSTEMLKTFEQDVRSAERAKWVAILRRSATQKRAWAEELREKMRKAHLPSEAATIHEREAVVWDCIADVIEDNNELPCGRPDREPA